MKQIFECYLGSYYFFNKFNDYIIKDIDKLCIYNNLLINSMQAKSESEDIFLYQNMSKQDFIDDINKTLPMAVGKFLIPEFVNFINFTIDELKDLKPYFDKLDDLHSYEKIIYNAYIENNEFYLTNAQLMNAYVEYKKTRKDKYNQNYLYLCKTENEINEYNKRLYELIKLVHNDFLDKKIYICGTAALYLQGLYLEKFPKDVDFVVISDKCGTTYRHYWSHYFRKTKFFVDIMEKNIENLENYKQNEFIKLDNIDIKLIKKENVIHFKELIVKNIIKCRIQEKHIQHLEYLKNTNQI